jgi:aryl-alcohol dehydrogenase-like predicted oxidoreductase
MQMRTLGKTNLQVAPICLGANVFGWTVDEAASPAVLDAYIESGGNFIDTANVYSGGQSETIIGRWMKARGNRNKLVVVTKVGMKAGPGPDDQGLSRHHINKSIEASLARLQTDYIDLYLAHRDDPDVPLDETLEAFARLVEQGKVRYIGASNYTSERLAAALQTSDRQGYARYVSLQPRYNLVTRADYEGDLEALCMREGLGVITYSSLASGFLSGKYRRGEQLPQSARATNVQTRYMDDHGFAVLDALETVAKARGATNTQVALAWILARPSVTAPIASGSSPEQVRELMGAADLHLTPEEGATLDAIGR